MDIESRIKISIETPEGSASSEIPENISDKEVFIETFYGLMVTLGFNEHQIANSMEDFAANKLEILKDQSHEIDNPGV